MRGGRPKHMMMSGPSVAMMHQAGQDAHRRDAEAKAQVSQQAPRRVAAKSSEPRREFHIDKSRYDGAACRALAAQRGVGSVRKVWRIAGWSPPAKPRSH